MSLIDDITSFILGLGGIESSVEQAFLDGEILVENIRQEARKIKNFRSDPKWKSRVINAPKAVDQVRTMVTDVSAQLSDAFHSLIQNLRAIKASHGSGLPGERGGGVTHLLDKLNQLRSYVVEIDEAIKSLNSLVDALRRITDQLQTFDALFLQQGNSRKVERLADGGSIKVRVGNLHS